MRADQSWPGHLARGGLAPVIDRTYPLAQIADAHRYVETGPKKGNVIIVAGAR
jgi:NADPH:quinone reductase-like Zn-dependent oxidoreductase